MQKFHSKRNKKICICFHLKKYFPYLLINIINDFTISSGIKFPMSTDVSKTYFDVYRIFSRLFFFYRKKKNSRIKFLMSTDVYLNYSDVYRIFFGLFFFYRKKNKLRNKVSDVYRCLPKLLRCLPNIFPIICFLQKENKNSRIKFLMSTDVYLNYSDVYRIFFRLFVFYRKKTKIALFSYRRPFNEKKNTIQMQTTTYHKLCEKVFVA